MRRDQRARRYWSVDTSTPLGTLLDATRPTLKAVAAAHGFTVHQLLHGPRSRFMGVARADLYARLRAQGYSYPEIGRAVGRDHSTVMAVLKAHRYPMTQAEDVKGATR